MTKFFFKLKKKLFLAHFPNFWDKKKFFQTIGLSCTTP